MHIAVIGASGIVGKELIQLLEKASFTIDKISFFASEKSAGKKIIFGDKERFLQELDKDSFDDIDIAFFCAGGNISRQWIPLAKQKGTLSIDLSSAFRMEPQIPLIIPEINGDLLKGDESIIASPNCTTTVLLMPLYRLHRTFQIKRIITSTYQAASGGGEKLLTKLLNDTKDTLTGKEPTHESCGFNVFLHESPLGDDLYSEEEFKMAQETIKLLEDASILVSATCVRVPVIRSHSVSANVEFTKPISLDTVLKIVGNTPGVKLMENNQAPTPALSSNKHDIYCGRFRKDYTNENTLEFWACGDQLLKGAALNAYQIAEKMIALTKATV